MARRDVSTCDVCHCEMTEAPAVVALIGGPVTTIRLLFGGPDVGQFEACAECIEGLGNFIASRRPHAARALEHPAAVPSSPIPGESHGSGPRRDPEE